MLIKVNQNTIDFRPWRPSDGRVFKHVFAFDTETTLIDQDRPWLTPAYVLGAASDGRQGVFVTRDNLLDFLKAHEGCRVIFHNAAFDLAVIHQVIPTFDIYRWVDQNRVRDTFQQHRLYMLGSEGHVADRAGQASLEACAELYLGLQLPKDLKDAEGNDVRLGYGRYLGRPPQEIPPTYLEYLAKDAAVTFQLFESLSQHMKGMLHDSEDAWGFVDRAWLKDCIRKHGWQTHHIQLKAAIVLREITACGLAVDVDRREEHMRNLEAMLADQKAALLSHGYIPGQKGSQKVLQKLLGRLAKKYPDVQFAKTEKKGDIQTSHDALAALEGVDPFVDALLAYRAIEKLNSSFFAKMGKSRLHPSFQVLVRSGRTSSFGELNAQNLPRDPRVRECFIPSPGYVFVDADYSTVELATLAQSVIGQFGIDSEMGQMINDGKDLHRVMAAAFFNKPEDDVTKEERQKAKAINFGKPGGMGNAALQQYAKASYGVEMTLDDAEALTDVWFDLFPEMKAFLDDNVDAPAQIAAALGLTPLSFYEHTGSRSFLDHPNNEGRESQPHAILGAMLLKAIKESNPRTSGGRDYSPEEIDYFWSHLHNRLNLLPADQHQAIIERRPSIALQRAIMREFGKGSTFTLTGRVRANASYTARHNTQFQGLAADGAKLALWRLWRAGYRIVNFIHDEVLIEIPENSNYELHAEIIRRLMIEGMKEVVPDVRIDVKYAVTRKWTKDACHMFDDTGRLIPYAASV